MNRKLQKTFVNAVRPKCDENQTSLGFKVKLGLVLFLLGCMLLKRRTSLLRR